MAKLDDPVSKIVQEMLVASVFAEDPSIDTDWSCFATNEPDKPDNCVSVFDTTGILFGRYGIDGDYSQRRGIQVRVRSINYVEGNAKIEQIAEYLTITLGTPLSHTADSGNIYRVNSIQQTGTVLSIGREVPTSKRNLFSCNFTVSLDQTN